jgi:hypothetical protein
MIPHIDECFICVTVNFFIEMDLLEINHLDSSFTPNSVSEGGLGIGFTVVECVVGAGYVNNDVSDKV